MRKKFENISTARSQLSKFWAKNDRFGLVRHFTKLSKVNVAQRANKTDWNSDLWFAMAWL